MDYPTSYQGMPRLMRMNRTSLMCCQAVLLTVPARSELYNVLGKDRVPENLSPGEVYTATADSSQEELDAQISKFSGVLPRQSLDLHRAEDSDLSDPAS